MIDLKELNKLLDKATPGEWEDIGPHDHPYGQRFRSDIRLYVSGDSRSNMLRKRDRDLIYALHNNAKELIRLAEIGQRHE